MKSQGLAVILRDRPSSAAQRLGPETFFLSVASQPLLTKETTNSDHRALSTFYRIATWISSNSEIDRTIAEESFFPNIQGRKESGSL